MNAAAPAATPLAPLFAPVAEAVLALADGTVFRGRAIGATGSATGEVVFNTAMTGYQEILTDPSYAGQIVTLTYPHIGNVGVNAEDAESVRPFAAGLVIRDLPRLASNWRAQQDLGTYLKSHGIVGIGDIDTRRLTRILRETRRAERLRRGGRARRRRGGECGGGRARAPRRRWPDRTWRRSCPAARPTRGPNRPGRWARVTARCRRRAFTSSPTISASSTTSCACWPSAAAA